MQNLTQNTHFYILHLKSEISCSYGLEALNFTSKGHHVCCIFTSMYMPCVLYIQELGIFQHIPVHYSKRKKKEKEGRRRSRECSTTFCITPKMGKERGGRGRNNDGMTYWCSLEMALQPKTNQSRYVTMSQEEE